MQNLTNSYSLLVSLRPAQ